MKTQAAACAGSSDDWAERGDYWLEQLNRQSSPYDHLRKFLHKPLILSGHGVKLRVDRGTLLVRGGFTHYPQQQEEWRFFPKDRHLPSRIVIIDGDGGITFDAMEWLSRQGIQLVHINWQGEVITVGGNFGYAAEPEIVRAQIEIADSEYRMIFANYLIAQKIENSISTVEKLFSQAPSAELFLRDIHNRLKDIRNNNPTSTAKLLGEEGRTAAAYFRCWHNLPLKWKGIGKKPIPNDWHCIGTRMSNDKGNQFARHPINAMLNYCYAVLQNRVQTYVLACGFDPYIGFVHQQEMRSKPRLVFDLMEPLRPIIDRYIFEFAQSHIFAPSDFTLNDTGTCKLHPQFARVVVKLMQDIPEIELLTVDNLQKLLALHPVAAKKSRKNSISYKARLVGKRK